MSSKFSDLLQNRNRGPEPATIADVAPKAPAAPKRAALPSPAPVEAPAKGTRGPKPNGKRSDEAYEQTTIYVRKDLKKAVRMALAKADDERDLSELLGDLLTSWLSAKT